MKYFAWIIALMMANTIAIASTNHDCDHYSAATKVQQTTKTVTVAPSINLDQLITRLKTTRAIGLFTKIALRSDVIALQRSISNAKQPIQQLRQQFDGLVLKILALLDDDPDLARDIYHARESIWQSLVHPKQSYSTIPKQPRSIA